MQHNSHLVKLAQESTCRIHPESAKALQISDGQKVELTANNKTISAKVSLDKNVAEKTLVLPLGFDELSVHEFGANLLNGLQVQLHAR